MTLPPVNLIQTKLKSLSLLKTSCLWMLKARARVSSRCLKVMIQLVHLSGRKRPCTRVSFRHKWGIRTCMIAISAEHLKKRRRQLISARTILWARCTIRNTRRTKSLWPSAKSGCSMRLIALKRYQTILVLRVERWRSTRSAMRCKWSTTTTHGSTSWHPSTFSDLGQSSWHPATFKWKHLRKFSCSLR